MKPIKKPIIIRDPERLIRLKSQGIKSKISICRHQGRKELQKHRGVLFLDCIPKSTKQDFKATCAAKGTGGESMRDAIIRLMRFYIVHKGIIPGQEEDDGE